MDSFERGGRSEHDLLTVLACDWQRRPAGAPSFSDAVAVLRAQERTDAALVLTFAPGSAALVEALAAAERRCCATMTFDVAAGPLPTLRVGGTPDQLGALARLLLPMSLINDTE